jgi:hypothetical protein
MPRRGSGIVVALWVTLAAAFVVAPAAAHAAGDADNDLEMKARESFAAGRYDEALDTFAKLYAKTLNPVYLRNIGRCFQKKRDPDKAIDEFKDYLAKTRSGKYKISADERAEIQGYIKEMEGLRDEQARAAVAPPPPAPVAPVAPQPATAPQPTAAPLPAAPPPADAANAPVATLAATPPPGEQSQPVYTRWWFWTIVGVVVAGAAAGTIVALSGGTTKPPCIASGGCQ